MTEPQSPLHLLSVGSFPVPISDSESESEAHFKYGFTTSKSLLSQYPHIDHVPLSKGDTALGVHKNSSRTSHRLVKPPKASSSPPRTSDKTRDPEEAWEAFYPKGSINPSASIAGGFSFYLSGPKEFKERLESGNGAKEVLFGYRMMLEDGWEWVKGGKLPGFFGGVGERAYGCTGGRQDHRCQCFDIRPMWRANGVAELYTYLPLTSSNATHLLAVPPISRANADYGYSVGRGAFRLDTAVGNWVSIAFRVTMNDVGVENGEIQLWFDGVEVISVKGLTFRESAEARIKGMHFQTFFGGHTEDWASPKDQKSWFSDIVGIIVK
ncbi:hypothetical protein Hypma_012163 [Hypsizygus marmoreus]|uniref:Polysaccharide lyase 14 domain-containing protein n=1 Tax=Hypsizygus marmoreus TaxID=39966 RepID=A0A369JFQ2_HYPMA|nr:hypothetical protein Hypma_012163 [Hypsizygus marmoreus]